MTWPPVDGDERASKAGLAQTRDVCRGRIVVVGGGRSSRSPFETRLQAEGDPRQFRRDPAARHQGLQAGRGGDRFCMRLDLDADCRQVDAVEKRGKGTLRRGKTRAGRGERRSRKAERQPVRAGGQLGADLPVRRVDVRVVDDLDEGPSIRHPAGQGNSVGPRRIDSVEDNTVCCLRQQRPQVSAQRTLRQVLPCAQIRALIVRPGQLLVHAFEPQRRGRAARHPRHGRLSGGVASAVGTIRAFFADEM